MKKFLKISAALLFGTLALLFALPFLFQDKIKAYAQAEIDKRLNAKVSFSDVHLSFIRSFPNVSMGLDELRLVGKGEFARDTLADIGKLRCVVDIKSFWQGDKYLIRRVSLIKPRINAIVHENGNANWDILKTDSSALVKSDSVEEVSPFALELNSYKIVEGNIRYEDRTLPMQVEIRKLDHSGEGNFTESIYDLMTSTNAQSVFVEYAGIRYINKNKLRSTLGININNKTTTYRLLDNEIMLNELPVRFKGVLSMPDTLSTFVDMSFESPKSEFKQLLSLIPAVYKQDFAGLKADGKLGFSGFVKGLYRSDLDLMPAFDVKLGVDNAQMQYPKLPSKVSGINIDMNISSPAGKGLDNMRFDIRKFQAVLGSNPLDIKGTVKGLEKPMLDVVAKAKLNLTELTQMFPIESTQLKGLFDVDASVNGTYDPEGKAFPKVNAKMAMQDGYVKNKDYPVELDKLNFQGTLQNPDGNIANSLLEISNFHFDLDKKPFEGKLRLKNFDTPDYDATVKGSLDVGKMTTLFPVEGMKLAGLFSVDGTAKGIYDSKSNSLPKMDMKMGMENGYVKNEEYKVELKDLNLSGTLVNPTGTMAGAVLDVPKLHLTFDNEPLDGKVYVKDFDNPNFDVALNGKVDLAKIMAIYPLEGTKLSGKLDIRNFASKGSMTDIQNEQYLKVPTSGKVQISDLKYESRELGYPVHVKQGNVDFSPSQLTLTGINTTVGKTEMSLNGNLTNYLAYALADNETLGGNLQLSTPKLNVNEWMGADEPTAKSSEAVVESPDMSVIPVPGNLNVNIATQANEVIYDNLTLKNFKGNIGVANHALSLKNIVFQTLGASFNLNGIYNTQNERRPLYGMDIDVQSLPFKEAYKYFDMLRKMGPIAQFIDGKMNTKVKLMGELNDKMQPILQVVNGEGLFEMLNGKIDGSPIQNKLFEVTKFQDFKTFVLQNVVGKFEIKDGFLIVAPFDMKLNDMLMNVGGRQALDGNMDFLVKLDAPLGKGGQAAQTALTSLTGGLVPQANRIKLDVRVGGTPQNPKILGVGKNAPQDLQNQAQQVALDKAQDLIKQQTGVNVPLNKDSLKQIAEDMKNQVVNEVKDKAEEAKDRALEQAQQQAADIKKKLEEEKRRKEEEIRKKAEEAKKRTEDSIKKALNQMKNNVFPFPKGK